jgi:hypothetical protein
MCQILEGLAREKIRAKITTTERANLETEEAAAVADAKAAKDCLEMPSLGR